jgi:hypothetical protein
MLPTMAPAGLLDAPLALALVAAAAARRLAVPRLAPVSLSLSLLLLLVVVVVLSFPLHPQWAVRLPMMSCWPPSLLPRHYSWQTCLV